MDTNLLKSELNTDPATLGYAALIATQDDAGLAAKINAKTVNGLRNLPSTELLAWSAGNGRMAKIMLAVATTLPPTIDPTYPQMVGLRSVAMAASAMINRDNTSLDLNLADRQQMFGVLVSGGVLNQADSDSLYALAAIKISRAEWLWGVGTVINPVDVAWSFGRRL